MQADKQPYLFIVTVGKRRFHPTLRVTLFCFICFLILVSLGIWQIYRYHYKQHIVQRYMQNIHAVALPLSKLNLQQNMAYRHVSVTGKFLNNRQMLLEHRTHAGRVGYDVITPFRLSATKRDILINRGWVAKPLTGLPHIKPIFDLQHVLGYIKLPEYTFILGKNILKPNRWPLVMQKIDFKQLAFLTHRKYYPFILRMDPGDSHGFVRDWTVVNVMPERDLSYAFQWFAMALAMIFIYFFISSEKLTHE